MEKYINWFNELNTLEKYSEIARLSKVIKQDYIRILNYKQNAYIVSKSNTQGKRNASTRSKEGNFVNRCKIHEENKYLLKQYIKLVY